MFDFFYKDLEQQYSYRKNQTHLKQQRQPVCDFAHFNHLSTQLVTHLSNQDNPLVTLHIFKATKSTHL